MHSARSIASTWLGEKERFAKRRYSYAHFTYSAASQNLNRRCLFRPEYKDVSHVPIEENDAFNAVDARSAPAKMSTATLAPIITTVENSRYQAAPVSAE